MNSLKSFVLAIGACMGIPTYIMAVRPYAVERDRQAVAYVMKDPANPASIGDDDTLKGLYYPANTQGRTKRGEHVYIREGCAQCHTQMVRPDYLSVDRFKKGAGREQAYENGLPVAVRQTHPWDYMGEDSAMLGVRRIGPDLANAGYRYVGDKISRLYQHLYAPRSLQGWSNSPSFKHLFEISKKETPEGSPRALKLPINLLPEDDTMEIIPTEDAVLLAEYLLSLKRDEPLPMKLTGEPEVVAPVLPAK